MTTMFAISNVTAEQRAQIAPLPSADHTRIDPIAEVKMRNPNIVVVEP